MREFKGIRKSDEYYDGALEEKASDEISSHEQDNRSVGEDLQPAPVATVEDFRSALIPLVSTVLGAHKTGHPDLPRHLQALSDLVSNWGKA